jgi:hypothetical protein
MSASNIDQIFEKKYLEEARRYGNDIVVKHLTFTKKLGEIDFSYTYSDFKDFMYDLATKNSVELLSCRFPRNQKIYSSCGYGFVSFGLTRETYEETKDRMIEMINACDYYKQYLHAERSGNGIKPKTLNIGDIV